MDIFLLLGVLPAISDRDRIKVEAESYSYFCFCFLPLCLINIITVQLLGRRFSEAQLPELHLSIPEKSLKTFNLFLKKGVFSILKRGVECNNDCLLRADIVRGFLSK